MDWFLFHLLNSLLRGNDAAQDLAELVDSWGMVTLAGATALLWFLSRPGSSPRSKLAAVSAGLATAVALLASAALGHLWYHPRPFADHPDATLLLVPHQADNSFPSDHAAAAFALASAVIAFHRRLGAAFLAGAALVGIDRILVGVHYPVDVAAGALVGAASAALVVTAGRPWAVLLVRLGSRVSDPVARAATRRIARARRCRPPRPGGGWRGRRGGGR